MSRQMYSQSGQKRILVASSTNAGARLLTPIVDRLRAMDNTRVYVVSHKSAVDSFEAAGIGFGRVEPDNLSLENVSSDICKKILIGRNPTTILIGAESWSGNDLAFEKMLCEVAEGRKVKSVAVFDNLSPATRKQVIEGLNQGSILPREAIDKIIDLME